MLHLQSDQITFKTTPRAQIPKVEKGQPLGETPQWQLPAVTVKLLLDRQTNQEHSLTDKDGAFVMPVYQDLKMLWIPYPSTFQLGNLISANLFLLYAI